MPLSKRTLVTCLAASFSLACSSEPAGPQHDASVGAHDASVSVDGSGPAPADASNGADGSVQADAALLSPDASASTGDAGFWRPAMHSSWQWMIDHALDTQNNVDMGLSDGTGPVKDYLGNLAPAPEIYDIDGENNTVATVDTLHALGKKVICYIDVGVYEGYRSDAARFPESVKGSKDIGWNDSYWLDIRRTDILGPIMQDRMQHWCKDKHFDAIEPDEIDGYTNDTKFGLTAADQLAYNRFIADMAHAMGMSIGMKGDIEQASDLEPWFDWSLNEQCFEFSECNLLDPFLNANKAVFEVEYNKTTASFCPNANTLNFNSMKMPLDLTGERYPCR